MPTQSEDLFLEIPKAEGDERAREVNQPLFGVQRGVLTFALSLASFVLALCGALTSLYIYKSSLEGLQVAQTAVQLGTVGKLANETKTTGAEAKYAEEMNRLQTANENLRTELMRSQTSLARAEAELAAADGGLKAIELGLASGTTGDPEFQRAVTRIFQQVVTPLVDCLSMKPGESTEKFEKRCKGKDLTSLFGIKVAPPSTTDPFGLQPLADAQAKKARAAGQAKRE